MPMHARRALIVCWVVGCGSATSPLSPSQYCAKVSRLVSLKDATVNMTCDCFTPLYEAMQRDNPASYACSARCMERSDSIEASAACEKREHCDDRVAASVEQPVTDVQIEAFCRRMLVIDDTPPHDGHRTLRAQGRGFSRSR